MFSCDGCAAEFQKDGHLCGECDKKFHTHPDRAKHNHQHVMEPTGVSLDLLSVICIETSHHVCFTRQPDAWHRKWIFFDSMANRVCKYNSRYTCIVQYPPLHYYTTP